jgi:hypothetical protein
MRYLGWLMLILLSAQAQPYKPACSEALALSPNAFIGLYVVLNNDQSEVGYNRAAQYWGNCKRQDNLQRLERYPALKARLEQLRKLYIELRTAETQIALEYYGGGTLYSHTLSRIGPDLETHLADLISLTTRALGAVQARGFSDNYDYARSQVEGYIQALRAFTDTQIKYTTRNKWNSALDRYENAYREILKLAGSRKDATSATLLDYVNRPLWIEEIVQENQ